MRKLFHILCFALVISLGLTITGCAIESGTEKTTAQAVVTGSIADGINSEEKNDYSFYVMKVKDEYMSIVEDCVDVYDLKDHISPDMEDGQIALVVADVSIVSGGYAGYCNDIFVNNVKSIEILDYKEVTEQVDIPVAGSSEFSYYRRFFKYENEGNIYFVFLDRQYIDVYANGKQYMQYEFADLDDDFSPFFASLG